MKRNAVESSDWITKQYGGTVVLATTESVDHLVENSAFLEKSWER